jgi:hypothetical protein
MLVDTWRLDGLSNFVSFARRPIIVNPDLATHQPCHRRATGVHKPHTIGKRNFANEVIMTRWQSRMVEIARCLQDVEGEP